MARGGDSVSLRAVEFGGAECAVGVEGADLLNGAAISALRAGLIARDAVEDGSCLAAKDILGVAAAGLGFDAAEALRVAGAVEDLAEGDGFEGARRVELGFEGVGESREFLLLHAGR